MSVAFYDMDSAYYGLIPFNLEIMKLAAYYKKQNEITVAVDSFNPDPYSTFILRKDVNDDVFPPSMHWYKNVKYGGLGFTNNKYIALTNDQESQVADTSIYNRLHDKLVKKKSFEMQWSVLTHAVHARLSIDGKNLWPDLSTQMPDHKAATLFLHDLNLAKIPDSYFAVKKLLEQFSWPRAKTRLAVKFPIEVSEVDDLVRWARFPLSGYFSSFCYGRFLEDDEFIRVIRYINRATFNKGSIIPTVGWSSENQFLEKGLPQVYRQLIFSCNQRKRFSLIYDDNFFTDQRWKKVFLLINLFAQAAMDWKYPTDNMIYFCRHLYSEKNPPWPRIVITIEEAREVVRFVAENQPELFELFKYCRRIDEKGGKLVYDRQSQFNH